MAIENKRPPGICFSPYAWLKLQYMLYAGSTEVGGFGISSTNDLLYIRDVSFPKQTCGWGYVDFDDDSVADHFEDCVEQGFKPEQVGRIWIHTHPHINASPSTVDEETFAKAFGDCDWSIMFIISKTQDTYARCHFSKGPGGDVLLDVSVDWKELKNNLPEIADNQEAWATTYTDNVTEGLNYLPNVQQQGKEGRGRRGRRRTYYPQDAWPDANYFLPQKKNPYTSVEVVNTPTATAKDLTVKLDETTGRISDGVDNPSATPQGGYPEIYSDEDDMWEESYQRQYDPTEFDDGFYATKVFSWTYEELEDAGWDMNEIDAMDIEDRVRWCKVIRQEIEVEERAKEVDTLNNPQVADMATI